MNKAIYALLFFVGMAACIFGIVMTMMAVRFFEWGRVLFYGMIALFSLELAVAMLLKLKKKS